MSNCAGNAGLWASYVLLLLCSSAYGFGCTRQPVGSPRRELRVHVLGDYEVCYIGSGSPTDKWRHALMRGTYRSTQECVVDRVQRYAVWRQFIVGSTTDMFFVVDSTQGDALPKRNILLDKAHWEETLSCLGIPRSISLLNPDDVAASRPAIEIYPEDYTYMKGLLGLPDGYWCLLAQVLGIIVCFCLGLTKTKVLLGLLVSITVGVIANIGGQMFMTGGGPALFVGMVGVPVFCCGGWGLGRAVRFIRFKLASHPEG